MMEQETSLDRMQTGSLSTNDRCLTVGDLERALLSRMPAADAAEWDRTGMFVGSPLDTVAGVAIALDPTIPALDEAYQCGANVLVTHHPVFRDAPDLFLPSSVQGHTPGAVVRHAIERRMSILSFHTALDVSVEGLDALPALLRMTPIEVLEPLEPGSAKGYGRICVPLDSETPLSLRYLSARCVSVFGSLPRVWGAEDRTLSRIVTSGGAASDFVGPCLDAGIDCLVCGEVKYHTALDASLSGLSIIELGHDVSEFPLCALLAAHVEEAGVSSSCITMVDQKNRWYTPESSRR